MRPESGFSQVSPYTLKDISINWNPSLFEVLELTGFDSLSGTGKETSQGPISAPGAMDLEEEGILGIFSTADLGRRSGFYLAEESCSLRVPQHQGLARVAASPPHPLTCSLEYSSREFSEAQTGGSTS